MLYRKREHELADQVEALYFQLEQVGALREIRHYTEIHAEEIPQIDLLQTAKALRCYAGTLLAIAGAASNAATTPRES